MMHRRILALASIAWVLTGTPSYADDSFYMELGDDAGEEAAQQQWQTLQRQYKPLLGKYRYFPKTVGQSSGRAVVRIQAGPVESKERAQTICKQLFKRNISCFVMEGLSSAPPSALANLSDESMNRPLKAVQLPWTERGEISPPPPIKEVLPPVAAPQKTKSEEDEEADSDSAPSRDAEVHVAEAIRVPLTQEVAQQQNTHVIVTTLPEIKVPHHQTPQAPSKYSDESEDSGPGWLVVEFFPNDEIATAFWWEVRRTVTAQYKQLKTHTLPAETSSATDKVSMSLGTFTSSSEAYQFCRKSVQAEARGLTCHFSNVEPGTQQAQSPPRAEPEPLLAKKPAVEAQAVNSRRYWIEVASASSQADALEAWNAIRSQHDDIVHGFRNNISVSTQGGEGFVVRLGPIEDHEEALHACAELQNRGVDCRVMMAITAKH